MASISCSTVLESSISASTGRSRMPLRPCPDSKDADQFDPARASLRESEIFTAPGIPSLWIFPPAVPGTCAGAPRAPAHDAGYTAEAPNWRHNIALSMMLISFPLLRFQLRFVHPAGQVRCFNRYTHCSTNVEPYRHLVAFRKVFCFSNTRFDRHNVAAIFGKQRSRPLGFADPYMNRYHSPAICHGS